MTTPLKVAAGRITQFQTGDTIDSALLGRPIGSGVCQGRLSIASTPAVPTSALSITAGTGLVYWHPFDGNQIALYNGTTWDILTFTAVTITSASIAGVYDVFASNVSGTVTLSQIKWTSSTVRATALALQDGVLVQSGTPAARYLGSYAVVGTTVVDNSSNRDVWNYYNRKPRKLRVQETTTSWTYGTSTWRAANNNTANVVNVTVGWADNFVDLRMIAFASVDATGQQTVSSGIGYDSTSATPVSDLTGRFGTVAMQNQATVVLVHAPDVGRHFYSWMEYVETLSSAATIFGVLTVGRVQTGLAGFIYN